MTGFVFSTFKTVTGSDISSDSPCLIADRDDYRKYVRIDNTGDVELRLCIGDIDPEAGRGIPIPTRDSVHPYFEMLGSRNLSEGKLQIIAVSGTGHADWAIA